MKKYIIFTGALVLASVVTGEAMAACGATPSGTRIQGNGANSLGNLLEGKTACKSSGSDWEWQEFHQTGGNLIDWKKGVDPVDPTEQVGSWSINSSGTGSNIVQTVTYDYDTGGSYTYSVWHQGGGIYDFCTTQGATDVLGATLKNTQGQCP